ncbi:MAG: 4Fe-4S binding protein [Dorea sp.]|nr:4Fe-4S binding protein [Dorea sp.]
MVRKIVHIDQERCNGCGACANACHEQAIVMINGKANLIKDDFCDGLGDCLPVCPVNAITIEEREAVEYDEEAVKRHISINNFIKEMNAKVPDAKPAGGCPGSAARDMRKKRSGVTQGVVNTSVGMVASAGANTPVMPKLVPSISELENQKTTATVSTADFEIHYTPVNQLQNWPVQIKLAPVKADYFEGAHLLIAADCTAYAYANFHQKFIKNRITLIGCPKLDSVDYTEKLTQIISRNNVKSVTIVRMEVPCCGGLEKACIAALQASGKFLPWQVYTVMMDGSLMSN